MKIVIDIPMEIYCDIQAYKTIFDEYRDEVASGILNGTPLPKGVTNGAVLCMLFPNLHYTLSDKSSRVVTTIGVASSFDVDWWNAPYKTDKEQR